MAISNFPIVTKKAQLWDSLLNRMIVTINSPKGAKSGIINKIEAEDGSGNCFIVTLHTGDKMFVRLKT